MCTACQHLLTRWLNSSEMLPCVFEWIVTEFSKKKKVTPTLARFRQSKKLDCLNLGIEDETIFRNVRNYSPNDTASRPRRLENSATPPWKPQTSHSIAQYENFEEKKCSNTAEYRHYIKVTGSNSGFGQFTPRRKSNLMSWMVAVRKWRR
jgi:hypothetical protein